MCGGGPKGPTAAETVAQTKANKELVEADTKKIENERALEKEKVDAKVMADNKAMAEAEKSRKQRQQTLLQGILYNGAKNVADEEDDTLPDGTAAPSVTKSKKKSKTILQSIAE